MNASGEVIWEVRPSSSDILLEGLEGARLLQSLKVQSAKKPDDATLSASVAVLAALGCQQRESQPLEELEKLAATKGLDAAVKALAQLVASSEL